MTIVQADKKWDLISLASIPLIMTLGNSMLIPVLPEMEKKLHIGPLLVSMVITVYSVVAIFLIPVAGYLSDRYGRKKVIVPSLIVAGVGGLISGVGAWWFKDSYWVILGGRFLQGAGAAGAAPVVLPLVGDMFRSDKDVSQGLGLIETSNTFGKVLSPILGAALAMWIWYIPFLAIPVFCAVSVVLVLRLVKTPKKPAQSVVHFGAFMQSIRTIFQQKGRWLYAIFAIGGICMFVIFGVLFYLSSRLEEEFGIQGVLKGLILAIPLVALCAASFLTGRKIGTRQKLMKWLSFMGCVLVTAAISVGALLTNIYYLIGFLFLGGIGIGLCLPCLDAFITEGIEKSERGTVTSMYSSMRYIGVAIGPPTVSVLNKISHQMVFFTISGACALAAILSLFAIHPGKNQSQDVASVPWQTEEFEARGWFRKRIRQR